MKRMILLITILLALASSAWALEIAPIYVGNGSADSIYVTVVTMDTTYYPTIANADSLVILRYGPDGVVDDSLGEDAATVKNLTTGYYRIAFRGSDATGTLGTYTIVVKMWKAGALRGIGSGTYYVLDEHPATYWAYLNATISSRGTSNFNNSVNKVILTDSSASKIKSIDSTVILANAAIAALNNFDPASDLVSVGEIKANTIGDSTIQDNATEIKADTAGLGISAYAEFTDGSNEDVFKGAASDTAGIATSVRVELTYGSNEDEFKATGFSIFDPATDLVKVAEIKAGTIGDTTLQTGTITEAKVANGAIRKSYELTGLNDPASSEIYGYFISGANEDQFKANVAALALEASVTKVRDSTSIASIWSEAEKDSVLAQTFGIALYWGAMNGYKMISFPGDTTYVDSMWHVKSGASPDSVKATTYVTFNAQYVAGSRFTIW